MAKQLSDMGGMGGHPALRDAQSKDPGQKGKRIDQPKLLIHER